MQTGSGNTLIAYWNTSEDGGCTCELVPERPQGTVTIELIPIQLDRQLSYYT